ncbi:dehydrogenase [Bacillus cereus]|nr:dehydrogenase [Bacillus cereus]
MYGRVFDGYETPDYKIAYALSFLLAQNRELNIHTEVEFNNDMEVYKVWITKHN